MSRSSVSPLKTAALLVGSIVAAAAVCEAAFRLAVALFDTREATFSCNPDDVDCFRTEWNRLFFRSGHAGPVPTDPGAFRIVAIGDSFTFGDGTSGGRPQTAVSYPAQLERLLNARFDDRRYEVVNLGLRGSLPLEEYFIVKEIAPYLHPDLVLVGVTANDVLFHSYNLDPIRYCGGDYAFDERLKHGLFRSSRLLGYLFTRWHGWSAGHVDLSPRRNAVGMDCLTRSLGRIGTLLRERGVPAAGVFVYDFEYFRYFGREGTGGFFLDGHVDAAVTAFYDSAFRDAGIDYAAAHPYFLKVPAREFLADDLYHYNEKGYRMLATAAFNHLVKHRLVPGCSVSDCTAMTLPVE